MLDNQKIIKEIDDIIFMLDDIMELSEVERKARLFSSFKSEQQNEKKQRECVCPGCKNVTIKHSHTIPKSSSLKNIQEGNKVLVPEHSVKTYNENKMLIEMNLRGIETEATTFPGFCKEHESLFSDFETIGQITDEIHYAKQCFRGICKDIFLRETEKEHIEKEFKTYKEERNKKVAEYLNARENFGGDNKITNLVIEASDTYTISMRKLIEKMDSTIKILNPYKNKLYRISKGESSFKKEGLAICSYRIGEVLPIALSGYTLINLEKNDDLSFFYMNIVPLNNETTVFFVIEERDMKELLPWFKRLEHPVSLLDAIEEFMIYGTNEWCIKPSVWNVIPKNRQEFILSEICSNKSFSFLGTKLSVFDEIRKAQIDSAKRLVSSGDISESERNNLYRMIEFESEKLEYNPSMSLREKEEKLQNMRNSFMEL